MDHTTAIQLESAARRSSGTNGVLHPDECLRVLLSGVPWCVRPLYPPDGIQFTPKIDGEDVTFDIDAGEGNVEVQALAEDLVSSLPEHLDGNTLVLDASEPSGYLSRVCKYLIALLDQQYDLTIEQKTELLGFRGTTAPAWLEQAIRHAQSMPPEPEPEDADGPETA